MAGPSLSHMLDPPQSILAHAAEQPLPKFPLDSGSLAATSAANPSSRVPASERSRREYATATSTSTMPDLASASPAPPQGPPPAPPEPGSTSSGQSHRVNNLYACRDCGRSYSRPEHLVRHVQTHTLGRRFICEICQKSFARKDLLRRHVANHENDTPQKRRKTASSPAAGRVTQACRPCAVARVKCDESKPCRRCINRKLSCVAPESSSAAAMHLAHLSPDGHEPGRRAPLSTDSLDSSPSASHAPVRLTPSLSHSGPDAATAKSTPLSQSASYRPDNSQAPTPDMAMDRGKRLFTPNTETYTSKSSCDPPDATSSAGADPNRSPFFDFLRDVLYEQQADSLRMPDSQGLAVLDFCDTANLELTDVDFGLLDHWNLDGMVNGTLPAQQPAPGSASSAEISQMRRSLVQGWAESPWRWDPKHNDTGYKEQNLLAVSAKDTSGAQFQESRRRLDRVVADKLEQSIRDQILAIMLSTCRQNGTVDRVASSFPTTEVMDTLVHIFLASQACQVDEWIHFPTFKMNEQWPEWVAMAAAMGGASTPIPTLRKFGFAVQEAVRITIPARFEANNTAIQTLGLVQSLILVQDLGLWSGNRRKMEIAECHLVIPVTMMRYRGRFQRGKYPIVAVDASDEGDVLEGKWKQWVAQEQWKRLVFHCYIREAQTSMTTLTNPCMSYAELTLPLPEARELWFAENAREWKARYLERSGGQDKRPPSVGDLFHDIHLLTQNHMRLDVQFSISIFLHGFWSLVLEYRQLSSVHRARSYANSLGGNPNLLLNSRQQELVKDLQSFQLIASGWQDMSVREHLLLNLLMMNLHVSLDDMQLFSGKEGEDQARRIYPVLQQWAMSSESRSAVWCAAQVLRYGRYFPPDQLKDFYAVAVHHAALALWTYGVVVRANRRPLASAPYHGEPIYLDGSDSIAIQRFIGFDHGRPLIKGPTLRGVATETSLHDPRACMDAAQDVLRCNFRREQELPPLVENLCHVMQQLGKAAWAVGLG
ncbi:hypothetical protein RJ55_01386 [Drechmeria coniospora]|nr:hypothetical protein RJ55_01386 [Drechmeria coniospora]